jgi:uncharacterized protein (DUF305 family)
MTRTSRTNCLAVLLTAGVLAACSAEEPPPPTNSAPVIVPGKPGEEASTIPPGEATPLEEEAPNDADVTFVRDMIVHHAQAVELADLAPDRADRKDVAGLADRIADTQRPEIDMLNRWLKLYKLPEVDPAGHGASHAGMPGMATSEQLAQLREARGAAFDRLFLQLMITHHEGALTMVEEVRRGGVNVRVQEIADDVAVVQSDEINRMRGMLGG